MTNHSATARRDRSLVNLSCKMLHGLPLFATDTEIATAVVGEKRAAEWVSKALPALEKLPGFPKIDALHGGRPVPVLNLFYENYLRLPSAKGLPDGVEGEWSPRRTK